MFVFAIVGLVCSSTLSIDKDGKVTIPTSVQSGDSSNRTLHLGAAGTIDSSTAEGALKGQICGVWACYATYPPMCRDLKIKWELECEGKLVKARKEIEDNRKQLEKDLASISGGSGGGGGSSTSSGSSTTETSGGSGGSAGTSSGSDTVPGTPSPSSSAGTSGGSGTNDTTSGGSGTVPGTPSPSSSAGTSGGSGTNATEYDSQVSGESASAKNNLRGGKDGAAANKVEDDGTSVIAYIMLAVGVFSAVICLLTCFLVGRKKKKASKEAEEGRMHQAFGEAMPTNKSIASRSGKSTATRSTRKSSASKSTGKSTRRRSARAN
eukprot:GEMP01036535.1.p1 GENE.GEMP01036535.1~~GEMP01036535.1.p1  ORF type:complete len:333 (+),score=49.50 GEMP01036535.1:34-999(+)